MTNVCFAGFNTWVKRHVLINDIYEPDVTPITVNARVNSSHIALIMPKDFKMSL